MEEGVKELVPYTTVAETLADLKAFVPEAIWKRAFGGVYWEQVEDSSDKNLDDPVERAGTLKDLIFDYIMNIVVENLRMELCMESRVEVDERDVVVGVVRLTKVEKDEIRSTLDGIGEFLARFLGVKKKFTIRYPSDEDLAGKAVADESGEAAGIDDLGFDRAAVVELLSKFLNVGEVDEKVDWEPSEEAIDDLLGQVKIDQKIVPDANIIQVSPLPDKVKRHIAGVVLQILHDTPNYRLDLSSGIVFVISGLDNDSHRIIEGIPCLSLNGRVECVDSVQDKVFYFPYVIWMPIVNISNVKGKVYEQ